MSIDKDIKIDTNAKNVNIRIQARTPKEKLLVKLGNQSSNYPPYNFICISGFDNDGLNNLESNIEDATPSQQEEIYILEIAVAGFGYKNLSITMSERYLTIEGISESSKCEYLHQGIARRNFKQMFKVDENMRLAGEAHLENGILRLMFIREMNNQNEVKTIPIYITTLKIAG